MIKRVMIRLCGYLFGLSVCVLHILLCYLLLGWVTTLVVMGVQLLIAAGFIYIRNLEKNLWMNTTFLES